MKREEVVRGLTQCSREHRGLEDCSECPYKLKPGHYAGLECWCRLCDDALTLLKEQEARVMAEVYVLHSTGKPIWFESRGMYLSKKGFWILPFEVDPELHIRFVQSVTGGKITFSLIDYGKVWRCWTSRPSEQQMRETPWEEAGRET